MRNNTFIHTAFIIVGLVSFLTVVEAKRGHRRVYDFDLLLSQSQEQQRNNVQVPASTLKSTSRSTAAYNVVEISRHLELEASTDDDDDNDAPYDYDDDDDNIDDVDDYEDVSNLSSESLSVNLDSCVPIGECQMCHGGKRSGHPGCSATGRRVKMSCKPATSSSTSAAAEGDGNPKFIIVQKSCNRTSLDEEYIMVRFQGLCLFIAFFALKSVRREKIATASLFDIRKNQRIRQEMVPLNSGGGGKNSTGNGTISKSSHSHSNGNSNSNNNGNNYFGEEGVHFQSEGSEAMA